MSYAYHKRSLRYRDCILPSGFSESQTWGALHKCWIGFVIAKEKMEWEKIESVCKANTKTRERIRN